MPCFTFTGELQRKGVVRPVTEDVYKPMLHRLKEEGVQYTVTLANEEEKEEGWNTGQ